MKRRYIAAGLTVGLVGAGIAAERLWGSDHAERNAQTPPAATASNRPGVEANVTTTPSVALAVGITCTRIAGMVDPAQPGGESAPMVKLWPVIQPEPNKGPLDVRAEYREIGADGKPSDSPVFVTGQDVVGVEFNSTEALLRMTVVVPGAGLVQCPTSRAELTEPEDSGPVPTLAIGPVAPSASVPAPASS